jgi:hypothetical protein
VAGHAAESSTGAPSRAPPPLQGPHWIGLRAAIEREWQRLGASDPIMSAQALKEVNDALATGARFGKLIDRDGCAEHITPERWREDLDIHADGERQWFSDDDEHGVAAPDLSTLWVKSRREPDRQFRVFVWAPPPEEAAPPAPQEEATPATDLAAPPMPPPGPPSTPQLGPPTTSEPAPPSREDALRRSLEAALRGLPRGPQIDRVYPALWKEFPPLGKAPKSWSIDRITKRLRRHWKAERNEEGLDDPSPDVVRIAVKALGRSDD